MNDELTVQSQTTQWFIDPVKTTFTTSHEGDIMVQVETQGETVRFSLTPTQAQEVGEFLLMAGR